MFDNEDYHSDLMLGDEEPEAKLEFEYDMLIKEKNRTKVAVVFKMLDGKIKSFHPDDVEYDEERKVIILTEKIAMRRGFV